MSIKEVRENNTPNEGRVIWNRNDRVLLTHINAFGINVRMSPYFAEGDGASNDQPAIQAAINDCHSQGGGYVYLPPGVYALHESILLKDGVNLFGAGMQNTTLRIANNVNQPVITDEGAGGRKQYAFGRVNLSNFSIDGNKANNLSAAEGIFTTAYFSTFENLNIYNCGSHGLRMGTSEIKNYSSQNRIHGCRIFDCEEAGIIMDVNGIDHTITENYIYDCNYGIVIKNGGIRVINNDLYNHRQAALQVRQTSYGSIISANDFNGNQKNAIHVTRTSVGERQWSQTIIVGNSILGNDLKQDNQYDAIFVDTSVKNGITNLSILSNKIFNLDGRNRYRYGINIARNVNKTKCSANHIEYVATTPYHVGQGCHEIELDSIGMALNTSPELPRSGERLLNPYHAPCTIYIHGGEVTSINVNSVETGLSGGSFFLPAGGSISLQYLRPPQWNWVAN